MPEERGKRARWDWPNPEGLRVESSSETVYLEGRVGWGAFAATRRGLGLLGQQWDIPPVSMQTFFWPLLIVGDSVGCISLGLKDRITIYLQEALKEFYPTVYLSPKTSWKQTVPSNFVSPVFTKVPGTECSQYQHLLHKWIKYYKNAHLTGLFNELG